MSRPQLADIERLSPSGGLYIECAGNCEEYRRGLITKSSAHRYYGYTKREALALWRESHPRGGGR